MKRASRLGWIAACLRRAGRFGPAEKKALRYRFDVSEPTISRDQAVLRKRLEVDDCAAVRAQGGKLWTVDAAILPRYPDFEEPSLDDWLRVMLGGRFHVAPDIRCSLPGDGAIRAMVQGIQERRAIFIHYVSRSTEKPTWRAVSPHAIVSIAGRYHARCFDHRRGRYGDFVLSRITGAIFDRGDTPNYRDARDDDAWTTAVTVRLHLANGANDVIGRLEYDLDESGSRLVRVQRAIAPYLLDRREPGFEDLIVTELVDG